MSVTMFLNLFIHFGALLSQWAINETSVTSVTSTTSVTSRGPLPLHHRGTVPDRNLHLPEPEKPPACGAGIAGTPDPSGQHRVEAIPKHGKTWQGSEGSDPERESTGASAPGRAAGSGILSVRSPNPEEAPRTSEGPFATVRRQPDGGCSKCAVQGAGSLSPEVLMARLPVMNIDCRSNGISNGAGQDSSQLSLSLYPSPSLNLSLPLSRTEQISGLHGISYGDIIYYNTDNIDHIDYIDHIDHVPMWCTWLAGILVGLVAFGMVTRNSFLADTVVVKGVVEPASCSTASSPNSSPFSRTRRAWRISWSSRGSCRACSTSRSGAATGHGVLPPRGLLRGHRG